MKIKKLTFDHSYYSSFHARRDHFPKYADTWHAHDEYEVIYINKGSGLLFIGDSIQSFQSGCAVFIGSNMPHYWLFDDYLTSEEIPIDCVVIQFKKDFVGEYFFKAPELCKLKKLLEETQKGILVKDHNKELFNLFEALLNNSYTEKFISLIQLLHAFEKLPHKNLVSLNYSYLNHSIEETRMNKVMTYIKDNYLTKIDLQSLAEQADMTKNSFCRYFKQKTSKTPIEFINELKIAYACRLLKKQTITLKQVWFESGFNNSVSFHKIFKEQLGLTPTEYRKMH